MRQLQGNLPKACCRTPREVDAADVVHSCFFSKGVFRDALKIVDDKINTLREQYDELEDDYYELEEEYFELLDKVECEDSAEEITE